MSGALIVIEIAAPRVSDEALAVLVSSCTRAARGAECVLAKDASDASLSTVAIVSLKSDDKMRVEVGVRQGNHDSWRTKDFSFLAADETLDRWRVVGFAIGTLAEGSPAPTAPNSDWSSSAAPSSAAASPTAPASPSSTSPSSISPSSTSPSSTTASPPPLESPPVRATGEGPAKPEPGLRVFAAAVGVLGPGLDRGPWRIGGGLRAEFAPRFPLYFVFGGNAAMRIAGDPSGATARWYDVSAGVGVPLVGSLSHSGLQLDASLLAEHFDVSVSPLGGSSDSRARWLLGGEGAIGGRVEVLPNLFIVADFEATILSAATDVIVSGKSIGRAPSFRYLGSVGLRVRLR